MSDVEKARGRVAQEIAEQQSSGLGYPADHAIEALIRAVIAEERGKADDMVVTGEAREVVLKDFSSDLGRVRSTGYCAGLLRAAEIADGFTCGGCGMDGKCAAAIRAEAEKEGTRDV